MADDFTDMIAPHLVVGLSGIRLGRAERELLAQAPPAGIILYHRNVESAGQLADLAGEAAAAAGGNAALLVSADHEGGAVSALARAIGVPPSQMAAWRSRDPALLAAVLSETGRQARRCGVNLILAPVADINSDPDNPVIGTRAFAETAADVATAVATAVRALSGAGLLTCLKHFPGHGATGSDSHLTLPVIDAAAADLAERELLPFRAGIEAGADTVMTAHVALRGTRHPASLDADLVEGVLRGSLGFTGVVITDALEMAGALPDRLPMRAVDPCSTKTDAIESGPAAVLAAALAAGNDLLLLSRPIEEAYGDLGAAGRYLRADPFWSERFSVLSASARRRIAALRARAAAGTAEAPRALTDTGDSADVTAGAGDKASAAIARRAVTLAPGGGAIRSGSGRPGRRSFEAVCIGARADFESYAVRRFAARLSTLLRRAESGPERGSLAEGGDVNAWFESCRLEGLREVACGGERANAGAAAHGGGALRRERTGPVAEADSESEQFFVLRAPCAARGGAADEVLVLLSRRSVPAEVFTVLARRAAAVVAAGRPWDAALVPEGTPVVTTYGVYDAAAAEAARILHGLP